MINQLDPALEAKRICHDVLQLNKMGTAAYRPPRATAPTLDKKPKPPSQEQLQRKRKVEQIRKKAQQDCKLATQGLNPKRKSEIGQLKQRRKKVEQELRQKQFQIKRLQEKRISTDGRRRCAIDQQHFHQFSVFRANAMAKLLNNLFFRAAKFSFLNLHKQVYYLVSALERKADGMRAKCRSRLAGRYFKMLKGSWEQAVKLKKAQQEQKHFEQQRQKLILSDDFYEFTLLRKSIRAFRKNKQQSAEATHSLLFNTPQSHLGKVKALVRELKQMQEDLDPIVEEASQQMSQAGTECMQPKNRQQQVNPNRKGLSSSQMTKKARQIQQRNKRRKEAIELKKKEREAKRQQEVRKLEEQEKRLKEEEKQRKLDELRKFEAKRRAEEERKRRRQEEQRTQALKLDYAAKYHERAILKFSGFMLLKHSMRVLKKSRQQKLVEFRQKRTERAWFYLESGLEVQRHQNQQDENKLKIKADSFKVLWLKRKLLMHLKYAVNLQKQEYVRLQAFYQVRLLKRFYRIWKITTPELAHANLVWESQACDRANLLIRKWLGRRSISVLKRHCKERKQERVRQEYEQQLKGKVNQWLQECSHQDIQKYLLD